MMPSNPMLEITKSLRSLGTSWCPDPRGGSGLSDTYLFWEDPTNKKTVVLSVYPEKIVIFYWEHWEENASKECFLEIAVGEKLIPALIEAIYNLRKGI